MYEKMKVCPPWSECPVRSHISHMLRHPCEGSPLYHYVASVLLMQFAECNADSRPITTHSKLLIPMWNLRTFLWPTIRIKLEKEIHDLWFIMSMEYKTYAMLLAIIWDGLGSCYCYKPITTSYLIYLYERRHSLVFLLCFSCAKVVIHHWSHILIYMFYV